MYCQGKLISSLFFFPFVWLTQLHGKTPLSNPSCGCFESHPKISMLDASTLCNFFLLGMDQPLFNF